CSCCRATTSSSRLTAAPAQRLQVDRVEVGRRLGREVAAEDDVLARLRNGAAVRRLEDVVARQHEQTRLELRLERERHVDGHLVAVEVGVERRADERMDTNGLAFD